MEKQNEPDCRQAVVHPAIVSAMKTIEAERDGLDQVKAALADSLGTAFAAAVDLIRRADGRVIVTGMGKSGHVGRKIASTLASTGTPAYFVHPAEASHGDLGMIQRNDTILALSWSGETGELADIISYARRFQVPLIAMTSSSASTLGREADIVLALPNAHEACPNGLAPTTSTTMQMALGDALAVALLREGGFSADDFKVYHPGGKLGARLAYVRDVMHVGDRLPLVPAGARISDILQVMTEKRFGCALVMGHDGSLAGLLTDGDLRRAITRPQPLETLTVDDVMTREPRTVIPKTLVVEALEMMDRGKLTVLPVVEQGKPVGIVHFLDLLRSGAT